MTISSEVVKRHKLLVKLWKKQEKRGSKQNANEKRKVS